MTIMRVSFQYGCGILYYVLKWVYLRFVVIFNISFSGMFYKPTGIFSEANNHLAVKCPTEKK